MNASLRTFAAYFNYIGSIELPEDVIKACNHSGPCDEDVKRAMELMEVKRELEEINPEQLKRELAEYGAWNDQELNDHQENLKKILWIAAGDIQESDEWKNRKIKRG